jgi:hypothetical protein
MHSDIRVVLAAFAAVAAIIPTSRPADSFFMRPRDLALSMLCLAVIDAFRK